MNLRRWICIVLLLVAPLQLTWAAVSAYCQHESGAATKHVGHHGHDHDSTAGTDSSSGDPAKSGGVDPDCAGCHLSCAFVLPSAAPADTIPGVHAGPVEASGVAASAAYPPPDRPQWRVPA